MPPLPLPDTATNNPNRPRTSPRAFPATSRPTAPTPVRPTPPRVPVATPVVRRVVLAARPVARRAVLAVRRVVRRAAPAARFLPLPTASPLLPRPRAVTRPPPPSLATPRRAAAPMSPAPSRPTPASPRMSLLPPLTTRSPALPAAAPVTTRSPRVAMTRTRLPSSRLPSASALCSPVRPSTPTSKLLPWKGGVGSRSEFSVLWEGGTQVTRNFP